MNRNIEIKARISDIAKLHQLAINFSKGKGLIINQEDTFFNCTNGRLKLRKIEGANEELIFYKRSDQSGPKLSSHVKVDRPPGELSGDIYNLLRQAYGVRGQVFKKRTLYMVGQTRVHVDEVQNLGNFMELEVMLDDAQTVEEGEKIAHGLMADFEIEKECLLESAYIDLLGGNK